MKILVCAKQKSQNYIDALEQLGANCVLEYSSDIDGVVFCGGSDISPSYYNQDVDGSINIDIERDAKEFDIFNLVIADKKPILGICRGLQLINVALGGTLIQDIKYKSVHSSTDDLVHNITCKNGFLYELYGDSFPVNSSHHQAIDRLGTGLVSAAYCGDIIEAIYHNELPILGVQFHPERMCHNHKRDDTVDGIKIFEYFLNLVLRIKKD